MATLTYAIQKVGNDYNQTDPQGPIDFDGYMQALDEFPWAAQHLQWNETQDGPLPSLVLQNEDEKRELWVGALGGDPAGSYQLHAVSMQLRKSLFGKDKLKQDVTTVDVDDREETNALCRLFFEGRYAELDAAIARLVEG